MYKVEKKILDEVVAVLDTINEPAGKNVNSWWKKRTTAFKKAAKLSQLIKDNYIDPKP